MSGLRAIIGIALLSAFVFAVSAGAIFAADPKAGTVLFATVDIEKAFDGSTKKAQLEQELQTYYRNIEQWFQLRNANKLLTAEEFAQLVELKNKPKQEEADKKKIDELLALSKQRDQELEALRQKQGATDAEKARLNELQEQMKKSETQMQEEEKKQQAELTKKRVELSKQVMTDVDAAVAAVAKEKGLTIVFNKSAGEPGLVVYSSLDITDEVLKRLQKK